MFTESAPERVAVVLQPSYVPWRGYFDLIRRADVFVFYDDVQYDKNGWRNRNRIKTASGVQWLTIPVLGKGTLTSKARICDIETDPRVDWKHKHLEQLRHAYRKAPHFEEVYSFVGDLFSRTPADRLSNFTIGTTIAIARLLGLTTQFCTSSDLGVSGAKNERLLQTLATVGATSYISGPAAKAYIDDAAFERAGIDLSYIDYTYASYEQLHPPYDPAVSILDLLFMKGGDAKHFISPGGST